MADEGNMGEMPAGAVRSLRRRGLGIAMGPRGRSAYQVWLDNGHSGSEAQFLASLKGNDGGDGTSGSDGRDGKSAYELAVAGGFVGTQVQWLASLKGNPGNNGSNGTNGTNGTNGKSAYEIAVAAGYSGTQAQWLASLQGAQGNPGTNATPSATAMGSVVVAQTAAIAIALGIRELTVALAGVVKGQKYVAFAESYRLNGGSSVVGRPAGYSVVDCVCNTDGQITVSLNAPLLAIGSSYSITCSIVRINT